jgi:formyltetrahydrofolate hydrolase
MVRKGRDLERLVLARALRLHLLVRGVLSGGTHSGSLILSWLLPGGCDRCACSLTALQDRVLVHENRTVVFEE